MNPIKHFHQTAMEYAVLADVAEAKGKPDDAKLFYRKAFELESEVVQMMPPDENEPLSRLVLLRSAAALAYHAGMLEEAEELVRTALAQNPPDFMVKELEEIGGLVKEAKIFRIFVSLSTQSFLFEVNESKSSHASNENVEAEKMIVRKKLKNFNTSEYLKLKKNEAKLLLELNETQKLLLELESGKSSGLIMANLPSGKILKG